MVSNGVKVLGIIASIVIAGGFSIYRATNYGFEWNAEHIDTFTRLRDCREIQPNLSSSSFRAAPAKDMQVDFEMDVLVTATSDMHRSLLGDVISGSQGSSPMYAFASSSWSLPSVVSMDGKEVALNSSEWNPTGMSLLRERRGDLFMQAINFNLTQGHDNFSIVLSRYNRDRNAFEIQHSHTFSEWLTAPHDLAALSPTEFYVVNHRVHLFEWSILGRFMDFLGLGGEVLFCSAKRSPSCRVVAQDISHSSSVVLSADRTKLYVSENMMHQVHVYEIDKKSKNLTLQETIQLDSFLEHMNVDQQGRIWVTGTMDIISTIFATADETKSSTHAPFIVYRITPKKGFDRPVATTFENTHHWTEIMFVDNGNLISPITSIAPSANGKLILSSSSSQKLIQCDIIET